MSTLTIGYIPEEWQGNEDDNDRVDVGDVEFSRTTEVTVEVKDGLLTYDGNEAQFEELHNSSYLGTVLFFLSLKKTMGWEKLSKDSLAKGIGFLKEVYIPKKNDKTIKFSTTEGPEILGGFAYKGMFYAHLYDDETEKDRLVVFS